MGRLINTTTMTVDAVTDVGDWFVAEGDHKAPELALFCDDAALLLGRKTYEGLAGYWPQQSGRWAELLNPLPKYVTSRRPLLEATSYDSGVACLRYQPMISAAAEGPYLTTDNDRRDP